MRIALAFMLVSLVGCDSSPAGVAPVASVHVSKKLAYSSSLSGRVVWQGALPQIEPIRFQLRNADGKYAPINGSAPNSPSIDPNGGVGGAVVYLRNVNPELARPWDHPPVSIELHTNRPMIRQGDGPLCNVGFVRRDDAVNIVSKQAAFHSLRARGVDFWSVALPDADHPRWRKLNHSGVVELSSGVTYFWMHGYIWVCEHPYFTRTNSSGQWTLPQIPPGEYELVAWLPNWQLERHERDPETGGIARFIFRPPLQSMRTIVVRDNEPATIIDMPINP